jgi:hypothetical protein
MHLCRQCPTALVRHAQHNSGNAYLVKEDDGGLVHNVNADGHAPLLATGHACARTCRQQRVSIARRKRDW